MLFNCMSELQSRWAIGLAAIVAIAYDIFFWREGLGNNWLWFTAIFLAVTTAVLLIAKRWHNSWAVLPALAAIGFALSSALYTNEFATSLAPLLTIVCSLSYVGLAGFGVGTVWQIRNFAFFSHFETIFTGWRATLHNAAQGREGLLRHIGYGLLIAAPFVMIFGLLFSSADMIFADWLERLNVWEYSWRALRTLLLVMVGVGLFTTLVRGNGSVEFRQWTWKMPVATVGVVLALLNLLFAAFVAIQIKYFFGQANYVLNSGLTYAEYARQGFFDLAAVMVIAAIIVVAVYRSYASVARSWLVTILQTVFVAQVAVVAVSALKRMSLYQDMYGFTTLRLYVEWFIYFALILLVLAAAALITRFSFRRFAGAVLAFALVAGTIISWINVDRLIAANNIARWYNGHELDTEYLSTLSLDAAPAVADLIRSEAFVKLAKSQQDDIERYWVNKEKEVFGTTPLSYTLSTVQAKMTFAELNSTASTRFDGIINEDYRF